MELTSATDKTSLSLDWQIILGTLELKANLVEENPLLMNELQRQFSAIWTRQIQRYLRKGTWKLRRITNTICTSVYVASLWTRGCRFLHRRKNSSYVDGGAELTGYDHYIEHMFTFEGDVPFVEKDWWFMNHPNYQGIFDVQRKIGTRMKIRFPTKSKIVQERHERRAAAKNSLSRMLNPPKRNKYGIQPVTFSFKYHVETQQLYLSFDAERRDLDDQLKYY